MTSAPHLDCTLHNHNHTHIAATHSTFLSEYPGITFHRAGLWCYYTPWLVVYMLISLGWLYVMPSALNGIVTEWNPSNEIFVPFLFKTGSRQSARATFYLFSGTLVPFTETSVSHAAHPVYCELTVCEQGQQALLNVKHFNRSNWQRALRLRNIFHLPQILEHLTVSHHICMNIWVLSSEWISVNVSGS